MYPWTVTLTDVLPIVQSLLDPWGWFISVVVSVRIASYVVVILRSFR